MPRHYSAALPIAYVVLRILVLLNGLLAAGVVALLLFLPHEQWILAFFRLAPSAEAERLVMALRLIAIVGLASFPLNHLVLNRLLAMTATVRAGDPFVLDNAYRLYAIAWALLGLQLIGLVIAAIAEGASTRAHPIDIDAGFSVAGWLAVLLTFVLARVFAEGAVMREELEGTV